MTQGEKGWSRSNTRGEESSWRATRLLVDSLRFVPGRRLLSILTGSSAAKNTPFILILSQPDASRQTRLGSEGVTSTRGDPNGCDTGGAAANCATFYQSCLPSHLEEEEEEAEVKEEEQQQQRLSPHQRVSP